MTKEDKNLLLKDLCARLPYGVKAYIEHDTFYDEVEPYDGTVYTNTINDLLHNEKLEVRPYLRPLSSMTEEEKEHLQTLHNIISDENYGDGFSPAAWEAILDFNNYCREHHLDNGGLIEKGLALEAPEDMYDMTKKNSY